MSEVVIDLDRTYEEFQTKLSRLVTLNNLIIPKLEAYIGSLDAEEGPNTDNAEAACFLFTCCCFCSSCLIQIGAEFIPGLGLFQYVLDWLGQCCGACPDIVTCAVASSDTCSVCLLEALLCVCCCTAASGSSDPRNSKLANEQATLAKYFSNTTEFVALEDRILTKVRERKVMFIFNQELIALEVTLPYILGSTKALSLKPTRFQPTMSHTQGVIEQTLAALVEYSPLFIPAAFQTDTDNDHKAVVLLAQRLKWETRTFEALLRVMANPVTSPQDAIMY
jgi:hypothetical protein